jgi:hypothetical protein
MYCPQCRQEYRPGPVICPDCLVSLVDELSEEPNLEDLNLALVYQTSDAGRTALAKSLLTQAEIPFQVRNENLQDLFGLGRLVPINPISGAVQFWVERPRFEDACFVLASLIKPSDTQDSEPDKTNPETQP